jgi:hypothetical protein
MKASVPRNHAEPPPKSSAAPDRQHVAFFLFFLFSLAAASASHWLATDLFRALGPRLPTLLWGAVSLILAYGLARWLKRTHHHEPWPKTGGRVKQFLLGLGVFIAGIWFALAVEHGLREGPFHLARHPGLFWLGCGGIIALASWGQSRLKLRLHLPRSLRPVKARELPPDQRVRGLILLVSPPNQSGVKVAPDEALPSGCHAEIPFGNSRAVARLAGKSLTDDLGKITEAAQTASREAERTVFFNWQPLMRALHPHSRLERIRLLGSKGDRGSFSRLDTCRRFLAPYLSPDNGFQVPVSLEIHPTPLDFEDFDALVRTIRDQIIRREWRDLSPREIAVDVTGGFKVASIAGAALTLNFEARVQYVQTHHPYEPVLYQLVMEQPPGPHGNH